MSVTSPTVPLIAITAEDSDDETSDFKSRDIADALTDIEDIETVGETKKHKTKTRKAAKKQTSPESTDNEDFEASDAEIDSAFIKHEHPVSLDDVLILEEQPTYDETFKVEGRGPRNRRKLKTQTSTSSSSFLNTDDLEVNQALTDLEDFNASGEESPANDEESDTDLLCAITQELGITEMSDRVRKQNQASPAHTPNPTTDNERVQYATKLRIPAGSKNLISPISMSPQLSDLTDVEILQSNDSNDEYDQPEKRHRCVKRNRRNTGDRDALTDTEDIYVSGNEGKNSSGEILMSQSPNFGLRHRKSHTCKYRSDSVPTISTFQIHSSDKKKCRKRACKKPNYERLSVAQGEEAGVTDIEDIEAEDSIAEDDGELDKAFDEEIDNVLREEFEACSGSIDDKNTTKNNKILYKTESFVVKKSANKLNLDLDSPHLTDEECFDQETPMEEREPKEIDESSCNIEFVPYKPKKVQEQKSNLLAVQKDDEEGVTDNEYLNSSDEEKEYVQQFAAVVSTNQNKEDTDSEEIGEVEDEINIPDNDIPDDILPKVVREKICIKESPDNKNVITDKIDLENEEKEEDQEDIEENDKLTDVEDMEALDDSYVSDVEYPTPDINVQYAVDEGTTSTIENIKSADTRIESEEETDYEEITEIKPPRKKKQTNLNDFLRAKAEEDTKLTDCEDFLLSDAENLGNEFVIREVTIRSVSVASARTDMEDLVGSDDNEQRMVYTPEPNISRQILNELGGTSVSTKDGNGPFTKQERKKLYNKNRPVDVTPATPTQTDTDEMFTSADDELSYSRAETATPAQMRQALDDATNSKVSTQCCKKIDLEAADEVMYIKGGGYFTDQYTDVEELGISEEEYYNGIGKNQVLVSIDGENDNNVSISVAANNKDSLSWKNGKVSSVVDSKNGYSVFASSVSYSLDIPCKYLYPEKTLKIISSEKITPTNLFSMSISKNERGYSTTIIVNSLPVYNRFLNMLYINIFKYNEIEYETYTTTYELEITSETNDPNNINVSTNNNEQNKIVTLPRREKINQLITKFEINNPVNETQSEPQEEVTESKIVDIRTVFNINKNETENPPEYIKETTLPTISEDEPAKKDELDNNIQPNNQKRNSLMERVKLFEKLCSPLQKPRQNYVPRKILKTKEWKDSQEQSKELTSSSAEQPSQLDQDAAQQDGNSSLGSNGVSRTQNYTNENRTRKLSYSYLDNILDTMLAEVEEQEKIIEKDPITFKPLCVNTLKLIPPDEAIIEIPVTQKKPHVSTFNITQSQDDTKIYETQGAQKVCVTEPQKSNISSEDSKINSCINIVDIIPSDEALIEIKIPSVRKRKINSHVNTYDFGKIESKVDSDLEHNKSPSPSELLEDIKKSPDIWYEGVFREENNIPEEEINLVVDNNLIPSISFPKDDIVETYHNKSNSSSEENSDDSISSDSEELNTAIPVKAEVKLLVKTRDNGKEEIELRSVRELVDFNKNPTKHSRTNSLPKRKISLNTNSSGKVVEQPTFTLQRLFVRSEDNEPQFVVNRNIRNAKNMSKSQPELFAASNMKYPLQYDISSPCTQLKHISEMRNSLSNFEYTKTNETDPFPSAYCDWLLPSDLESEGITTSSTKTIIITDKNIKNDSNTAFIESESHSESPKDTPVKKQPGQESPKMSDKEEKKEKKGFFSSLFAKKDSPKKSKKDVPESPKSKPRAPTPEAEKKTITINDEPPLIVLNRDSIPDIDEVITENSVQITDLDVDPVVSEDIKNVASTLVDNVITDGQTLVTKILEQKDKSTKQAENESKAEKCTTSSDYLKKNESALSDPLENWKELTTDMIKHEIEFQGWADSPVTKQNDEKHDKKTSDEVVKEETPKPKKSKGLFKLFGKKESRESDESDTPTDDPKSAVTTSDSDRETEKKTGERRKKKRGKLFGIFNKKEKKEKDTAKIEEHEKAEVEKSEKETSEKEIKEFSEEVQQHMVDTAHFLMYETEVYEDVRIKYPKPEIPETKKAEEHEEEKTKSKKHGGFLSFLGSNEEKDKEKVEKKTEEGKSGGFFSSLGQKISHLKHEVEDTKHKTIEHVDEKLNKGEEKLSTVVSETEKVITEAHEDVKDKVSSTEQALKDKVDEVKKETKEAGDKIDDKITEVKQDLTDKVNETKKEAELIKDEAKTKIEAGQQDIKNKIEESKTVFEKMESDAVTKINETKQDVADKVNETNADLQKKHDDLQAKVDDTKETIKDSVEKTKAKVDATKEELQSKVDETKQNVTETIHDTKQTIQDKAQQAQSEIAATQDKMKHKIDESEKDIIDKVHDVEDQFKTVVVDTQQNIKDKAEQAKDKVDETQKEVKQKIEESKMDITDKIYDAKHELKSKMQETQQNITDKIDEVKTEVDETQKGIKQEIDDSKKDMTDKVHDVKVELDSKISDLEQNINDNAQTAKTELNAAQEEMKHKMEESIKDVSGKIHEVEDKLKRRVSDAEQKAKIDKAKGDVDSAKQQMQQKILETKKDVKDKVHSKKDELLTKISDIEQDMKDKVEQGKSKVNATQKELEHKIDEFKSKIDETKSNVQDKVEHTKAKMDTAQGEIKSKVDETNKDVQEKIQEVKDKTKTEVDNKVSRTEQAIKDKIMETKEVIDKTQDNVFEKVHSTKHSLKQNMEQLKQDTKEAHADVKSSISTAKQDLEHKVDESKKDAQNEFDKLASHASGVKQKIDHKIDESKEDIKKVAVDAKDKIELAEQALIENVEKTKKEAAEIQKEVNDEIVFAKVNIMDTADKTKEKAEKLSEAAEAKITGVKHEIAEKVEVAKKEVTKTGEVMKANLSETKEKLKDKIDDTKIEISKAQTQVKDKISDIKEDIKEKVEDTKKETNKVKDELTTEINKAKQDIQHKTEEAKMATTAAISNINAQLIDFKDDAKNKVDKIHEDSEQTKEHLVTKITDLKQDFKDTTQQKVKDVTAKKDEIKQEMSDKFDAFDTDVFENINGTLHDLKEEIKEAQEKSEKTLTDMKQHNIDSAFEIIQQDFTTKISDTESDLDKIMSEKATKINIMEENLKVKIDTTKEEIKNAKEEASNKTADVKDTLIKTTDTTKAGAHQLVEELKTKSSAAKQDAKDFLAQKEEEIKTEMDKTVDDSKSKVHQAESKIKDSFDTIKDSIQATGTAAKEKMASIPQDIQQTFTKTNDSVFEMCSNFKQNIIEDDQLCQDTTKLEAVQTKTDNPSEVVFDMCSNFKQDISEKHPSSQNVKETECGKSLQPETDILSVLQNSLPNIIEKTTFLISDIPAQKDQNEESPVNLVNKQDADTSFKSYYRDNTAQLASDIEKSFENLKLDTSNETEKVAKKNNEFEANKKIVGSPTHKLNVTIEESILRAGEIATAATLGFNEAEDMFDQTLQEEKTIPSDTNESPTVKKKKQKQPVKETHRKISEQNIDLSNISHFNESMASPKKIATKTKSDSVFYVTTPTMQRRGIGGSQKLTKDERPSLIDISHIQRESSSDDEDYIVTEPADDFGIRRKRYSPTKEHTTNQTAESKTTDERISSTKEHLSDTKRKPIFHIESEEDSFDRGVQNDSQQNKTLNDSAKLIDTDDKSKQTETEYDVDLIEKKLSDINKALESLEEQAESLDDNVLSKNEHKLKRVERKFERMASETIEKDKEETKKKEAVTSPEVEAKREAEFQKIVSQLSREEVSDSQNVYSNLWDEITFTPSEEWDSKTPDSPPEEIQDLPQGEIVYMGPVTLNKDNLINKAGIEIDIIPIKRSPCSSPQPRRAIKHNIRARSEMGFYSEKEVEDTNSLPDLERVDKKGPRFDIKRGKIMSAVKKFNDDVMSRSYDVDSTSSSVYNSVQDLSPFLRRKSDSVTKGSLVNIVKDWMEKSSPFGSTENIRSVETISLADTNISVCDDDDSIEISFSDCGASQHDTKSDNVLPDIFVFDDENVPLIFLFDDNIKDDVKNKNSMKKGSHEESSCGPLTHVKSEGYAHLTSTHQDTVQSIPTPKPRINKLTCDESDPSNLDTNTTEYRLDDEQNTEIDSYTDRKKFWETITTTPQEITAKKRMSLYEEPTTSDEFIKKRASIHEIPSVPPVPKPRSTKTATSLEEENIIEEQTLDESIDEIHESEIPEKLVSEYMASYQYPQQSKEIKTITEEISTTPTKTEKSDSIDSEKEYISKFGALEAYENVGYESDGQEDTFDTDAEIIDHNIPQLKQRQMSVSQPPVAASRKTIYERSVSLPGEDLQEVSEQSVKARKRFFEEQIKNEMVIDQLMTQLDEEPVHEVKTLVTDIIHETQKTISSAPELMCKESENLTSLKLEPKFSPTSSSSQDTKTEDDITQDTPGSVKDITRSFQVAITKESVMEKSGVEHDIHFQEAHAAESEQFESSLTESSEDIKNVYNEMEVNKDFQEDIEPKSEIKSTTESMEQEIGLKQQYTESDQSISSERSLELGSVGDIPVNITNGFHYKSDSISKPSDSMEVHVDKSETEDSEKMTDNEQDFTSKSQSFEMRSNESAEHTPDIVLAERKLSFEEGETYRINNAAVNIPKEQIPDTVWEVVQSQPLHEIDESVTEISPARGEATTSRNIPAQIEHTSQKEVEKLILESLYHQKVHPDEAKKIAAELIDEIESEIEKRNILEGYEFEREPPVPHPDVAKRQISEYLRQLAESKGLDEREVQLVESVLARKQSQISRLSRRDTQTSSMEITDEDLKYSGAECDLSPYESQENILEEIIEPTESEKTDSFEKKEQISEHKQIDEFADKHYEKHEEKNFGEYEIQFKSEADGKAQLHEEITKDKKVQVTKEEDKYLIETTENVTDKNILLGNMDISDVLEVKTDNSVSKIVLSATLSDKENRESTSNFFESDLETKDTILKQTELAKIDIQQSTIEGVYDSEMKAIEKTERGIRETSASEKTEVIEDTMEESEKQLKQKEQIIISEDGVSLITIEKTEETKTKTEHVSKTIDHKVEEVVITTENVIPFEMESIEAQQFTNLSEIHDKLKQTLSDDSKSSQDESFKSPEDKSSSSSARRNDTDSTKFPEVIFRKSRLGKDSSSSSGNLRTDRKSGADFETYSSSGESHYHSFEDSARSRPCSSDVEGLFGAGSSEYESALTTQDVSSRSHITSGEYHTAVSSLSSRESMKSLNSESSGNMASIEISEASETLVPSTFESDGDILDGVQTLDDEIADLRLDEEMIDNGFQKIKQSFESDSENIGGSIDISEEDNEKPSNDEMTGKMKRSQEMTFQPEPKAVIADSPQSENALEMDERFGTSLEDGSVLSMSLSSASDIAAVRTVIERSRRDSEKKDSLTVSAESGQISLDDSETFAQSIQENMSASNASLDQKYIDMSTSTAQIKDHGTIDSVTITTSSIDENGAQSVSTQVTSQTTVGFDMCSSDHYHHKTPSQAESSVSHEEVVEPKRKGHRRNESTTFTPSMISGFASVKSDKGESEKFINLTLKEVQFDELKDVDETERCEEYETEADQNYYKQQREANILDDEDEHIDQQEIVTDLDSQNYLTEDDKPESELMDLMQKTSDEESQEPIERPFTPEPPEQVDTEELATNDNITNMLSDPFMPTVLKRKSSGVFEEAEADAAFAMVEHVSPAHKAKPICPILEDEDAEKHELETRERAQKDMEQRRAQILKDASPGSIPDIMVTQHMTPLHDSGFHYPDLELEEKELEEKELEEQKSAPETPASNSSKSSEDTDQGQEYVLEETHSPIPEEPEEPEKEEEKPTIQEEKIIETPPQKPTTTVVEKEIISQETVQSADSPNSDSFELLEQPDIIDDFVVIEEVAREAAENDSEGKSVQIQEIKYIRKHDEEVEEYLVRSAPTPLTRMTDLKYYPDGSSGDELGPFDFEDSPPNAAKKDAKTDGSSYEYERDLEANKKWIEMQFQGDQASLPAGYGYEMEFERGPLEDIKEEEATDFDASSRIGSLESQKHSGGSLGSVKDSFSSTPDYDVLAGRKFFTRSGEHDDVSMSSLQEFEHLERVISLENRRHHQGSQDSSSNGSFTRRYHASRGGQGDDISLSSLKEFEGLESACIAAHTIEIKAKEEEALLTQIDEAQENQPESLETVTDSKISTQEKEEDDYDKRMFEIDEIIKQAQSNVEKFIDLDKEESIGRGDSLEEVAKVPDLELDEPILTKPKVTTWSKDDPMETSMDSLADQKPTHHESTDSLEKKTEIDLMTASTDSIEFQAKSAKTENIMTDSIEIHEQDSRSCLINSDSLELTQGTQGNLTILSDSIDEDGSRIGEYVLGYDQSSSSGRGDEFSSSGREEHVEPTQIQNQCAEFLIGSTDSLDPTSSTATHATYQYETDSVMSSSFTSGGSNTMVSSTDTIDPHGAKAYGVDIATVAKKVWFDDDAFEANRHFTTEFLDDGSKPFVTEVIEPCEDDPDFSHTVHRRVEMPPEIKKITFHGPDADQQLRQYVENFGEGEDVQEFEEIDKDGNVHVKRVVQKRFIVKADDDGAEKRLSGAELDAYLQKISSTQGDFDLKYKDTTEFEHTRTDTRKDTLEDYKKSMSSSDVKYQQEASGTSQEATTRTVAGTTASQSMRAQGTRRRPLRYDISIDDQTEVDPREHDWRFNLNIHAEEKEDASGSDQHGQRQDLHELSSEMKELLEEMEKQAKK